MATAKKPIVLASKLPVPQDPHGFMVEMRRELARSIGRVKHNEGKQEALLKTLAVFKQYALDRFKDAQKREASARKSREAITAAAEATNRDAAAVRAEKLRNDAETLAAQADRIEGKIK